MWNTVVYRPIVNLILFLYKYLGENLGIAILALVIILRIILWPLTNLQMKSSKKLQQLQPRLKELQSKPKSELTMADIGMSKDVMLGCGGGCLPTLIQIPFLIAIYKTIQQIATSAGTVFNNIAYSTALKFPEGYMFNTHFLGIDLAKIPSSIGFRTSEIIPYIFLCILVGVAQWLSTKLLTPPHPQKKKEEISRKKSDRKKEELSEDMNKIVNTQLQLIMPILIIIVSFSLPAALSVYWGFQSILAIIQAVVFNYGGQIFPLLHKKGNRP